MLPNKLGWETNAALLCYKRAAIAETVLQQVIRVHGLRDPVVIQRARRQAAKNDERNDSSTWGITAVHCQPHVPSPYSISIANLPWNASMLDLYKLCSPYGGITPGGVEITTAKDGRSCRGSGIVEFTDKGSAEQAISMLNGLQLPDGYILKIGKKAESTRINETDDGCVRALPKEVKRAGYQPLRIDEAFFLLFFYSMTHIV